MTDRSVSWTDDDRVASLLSRVGAARRTAPVARGSSITFGGNGAQARPLPAGLVAEPRKSLPPKPVPKVIQTSDYPSDRLDTLVAWTLDYHRCTGAFVADDNGLTLARVSSFWQEVVRGGLLVAAVALDQLRIARGRADEGFQL